MPERIRVRCASSRAGAVFPDPVRRLPELWWRLRPGDDVRGGRGRPALGVVLRRVSLCAARLVRLDLRRLRLPERAGLPGRRRDGHLRLRSAVAKAANYPGGTPSGPFLRAHHRLGGEQRQQVCHRLLDVRLVLRFEGELHRVLGVPEYAVKLTLESKDEAYVEQAMAHLLALLSPESVVRTEEGPRRGAPRVVCSLRYGGPQPQVPVATSSRQTCPLGQS